MRDLFSLKNQIAIITGGSGYLGSAMTEGLLFYGAEVIVADVVHNKIATDDKLMERLHHIPCDVSSAESIRQMFAEVQTRFGKIDIMINNAYYGAGYGLSGLLENMSDEDWEKGVDGAVGTCFRCTREVIPHFKERGKGNIINIASMYGMVSPDPRIYGNSGANNPPNYGAGKAAVIQFTRYCAAHLASYGIRVNSISPGPFPQPDYNSSENETFLENLRQKTMLGRTGKAEEIIGAVIYLASSASDFVTGTNLTVDGGWTAW